MEPKILLWDIETTPNTVATFTLRNDWIHPDFILKDRSIICISYKYLGEDEVHHISVIDKPRKFQKDIYDDSYVVKKFFKVIEKADILVAYNGDKFDLRFFNTRALIHGLPPLPVIPSVDPIKVVKKTCYFNSNSMDYISKLTGSRQKLHTDRSLWMRILSGDADAVRDMIKYNVQDIQVLEDVYLAVRPLMTNHPNLNLFIETDLTLCPICGSTNIHKRGFHYTKTTKKQRYKCQSCRGWSQSGKSEKRSDIR